MSNLLAELAGVEFASQYDTVNVTSCKVKKEHMSMNVDLESGVFPCALPFGKLRGAIRTKFGVSKITFKVKYIDFKITEENKKVFFNIVREYICFKKANLLKVLTGSSFEVCDNILTISIRFGNEEMLKKENADAFVKEYIQRSFGLSLDVKFDVKEEETKLLEEIEEKRKTIAAEVVVKTEKEEPPKKKEVVAKEETEEEKDENLVIGRDFSGEVTPLSDITEYSGKVIVSGKIIATETKETRNGNHILSVYITDDTSAITCKCFVKPENILDIATLEDLWGKDMDESFIAIKDLKVSKDMVTLMSPDKKPTLKITLPNKVSLIKFGSNEEEYNTFLTEGYIKIDVVGKCNANEWNGYTTAQLLIEDYQIVGQSKYCF